MEGKRSSPVLFLLLVIFMISFSNAELQYQTLFLNDDDARLALYRTAASIPDSHPGGNFLSMEMIHRDQHPTFVANNVNLSSSEIMKNRLQRDQMRVTSLSNRVALHPSSTANTPVIHSSSALHPSSTANTPVIHSSSAYFSRLGIGTPPRSFYMVLDTGSDVTWLQCQPCKNCYGQTDPIFDPKESSTYQDILCGSKTCDLLGNCIKGNRCQYAILYGDGSYSSGDFANETVTLGNNIRVAGIALGCGHDNEGTFDAAAGILGLGRGNLSFPNQLGSQQYRRQFSYCLVSRGSRDTSTITFGQTPLSSKPNFTPMLTNKEMNKFYYVNLTGISVGGSDVQGINSSISDITADGKGGVVIDSGTTITRLEKSAYVATRDAFCEAMGKLNNKQTPPPADIDGFFDTCYDFSSRVVNSTSVPTVVLHFANGADMQLRADNCLVKVDQKGTFCFAFAPSDDVSIIGNTQQQGFGIVFDLETMLIGITPGSC